jgi:D-glycero-beta-D-manno-heptose 1-phosphate adenylyltransferase
VKRADLIQQKIVTKEQLQQKMAQWRSVGKTVVFTNGVFDVLHAGHIASLSQAAAEGTYLVVALNTDASVKRLKGESRPINKENDRALIMAAMAMVDAVVLFEEDTPFTLIQSILPDVIVKGGDYTIDQIVGAKEVIANGGRVIINPILNGYSSTNTIAKLGL